MVAESDVLAPATTGLGVAETVTDGATTATLCELEPGQPAAVTVTRSVTGPVQYARNVISRVSCPERISPFSIDQAYVPVPATEAVLWPFGLIVAAVVMMASGGVQSETRAEALSTLHVPLLARAKNRVGVWTATVSVAEVWPSMAVLLPSMNH